MSPAAPRATETRPLRFLPLLAAAVFASTAAFTLSSFVLAELAGTTRLTRSEARFLDLLVLAPLAGLPVLLIVLRHAGYAVSVLRAALALLVGDLVAYGVRSYIEGILTSPGFATDDERSAVIAYGYLGWLVGPIVITVALLALSGRYSGSRMRAAERASALALACMTVGLGLAAWMLGFPVWAIALGAAVWLSFSWAEWRSRGVRDDGGKAPAANGAGLMWVGFGAALALVGALQEDLALSLLGLPLLALGMLWWSTNQTPRPR